MMPVAITALERRDSVLQVPRLRGADSAALIEEPPNPEHFRRPFPIVFARIHTDSTTSPGRRDLQFPGRQATGQSLRPGAGNPAPEHHSLGRPGLFRSGQSQSAGGCGSRGDSGVAGLPATIT